MTLHPTPTFQVPELPPGWDLLSPDQWDWRALAPVGPFSWWDGSRLAQQQTHLRLCASARQLYVRFDCEDRDIWGTYTHRDEPLYDEEVVEVFLAPGEAVPVDYFEFEISPLGVLFDARVHNPEGRHQLSFAVDVAWNCPGILGWAVIDAQRNSWSAGFSIPWRSLFLEGEMPLTWRANFYRIERPRDAEPEFSCWSPTLTPAPDFHVPGRFGCLSLPLFSANLAND